MKNQYRRQMDAAEKKSVAEQMDHLRLMLDKPLTPEQSRYVKKALGYCWVDGLVFQDHVEESKEKKMKKLGRELVRTAALLAVLFAVLPSNARAQGINQTSLNNTGTINSMPTVGSDPASSINNAKSIGGTSSGSSLALNPLLQPQRHAQETGSKNDSNWMGPNRIVSLEEAAKLAEQERLRTGNSNLSIADAAKRAKEEAEKAKAQNPSKTEMVAMQDADGNVVYVRKARKQ